MTSTQAVVFRTIAVILLAGSSACEDALVAPECAQGSPGCEQVQAPGSAGEPKSDAAAGSAPASKSDAAAGSAPEPKNDAAAGSAPEPKNDAAAQADPNPGTSCVCTTLYKPVCGKDGKTYSNACAASCAKVSVAHEGACTDAGASSDAGASTDASVGLSCQSNADCGKGTICDPPTHQCKPECSIACLVYDPVCGADGKTYGCGKPDAYCHGVEVAHEGSCTAGGCSYEGKPYAAGASFPSSDGCNTCSCSANGAIACTEKACLCNYDDPARTWAAKSAKQCQLVKFACAAGQRQFFNDCGCGCEPEPTVTCRVGGCSSQLCVGPGEPDISTCEWRAAYACYKTATCELQAGGRCGFTQTDELRRCLEAAQ